MSVEEEVSASALLPASPLPRLLVALGVTEETSERSSETVQGLALMSISGRSMYRSDMSLCLWFCWCSVIAVSLVIV